MAKQDPRTKALSDVGKVPTMDARHAVATLAGLADDAASAAMSAVRSLRKLDMQDRDRVLAAADQMYGGGE